MSAPAPALSPPDPALSPPPASPPDLALSPPPASPPDPALSSPDPALSPPPESPPDPALSPPPTLPSPPPESPPAAALSPPPAPSPPPPKASTAATGVLIVLIVGIVMGVLIIIVAVGFCVIWRRKKRRRGNNNGSDDLPQGARGVASNPLMKRGLDLRPTQISFSYEELSMASDQFSDANLLGEGGFGFVHKGVLPNGKEVAIKHLKSGSVQGDREFGAEVEIISRVHHKHLVSLVGYCVAGAQRMLVYEFIPNVTLYFHLHGKERPVMNWPTRMKIALGSAKGLAYLHEDCPLSF